MKKLIIIGGKGNGTVVLSIVEHINKVKKEWDILGFLNDKDTESISGYPILGKVDKEVINEYLKDDHIYFFYTLISVKLNYKFIGKLESLGIPRNRLATLIHPTAVISTNVKIGYGSCISAFTVVNEYCQIGDFVQIWAQVYLGTGVKMGNYTYAAGQAYVGSYVEMAQGAYVGPSASILEFVSLGEWSLVGMGSNVIRDVDAYTIVVGNPAKPIGKT